MAGSVIEALLSSGHTEPLRPLNRLTILRLSIEIPSPYLLSWWFNATPENPIAELESGSRRTAHPQKIATIRACVSSLCSQCYPTVRCSLCSLVQRRTSCDAKQNPRAVGPRKRERVVRSMRSSAPRNFSGSTDSGSLARREGH